LSLVGSTPYTSTDKTNIHKRNSTKTQYKQYKTQKIQVHLLPKQVPKHRCFTFTKFWIQISALTPTFLTEVLGGFSSEPPANFRDVTGATLRSLLANPYQFIIQGRYSD
jgi:hypothetical protein